MAFQVSPGVQVREIDLSTIIPAVSTTVTGFAGFFQWGPLEQRVTVSSINDLNEVFQGPNDDNFNHWFTAANFLGYGNNLQVVRVVNQSTSFNAIADPGGKTTSDLLLKNEDDYEGKAESTLASKGFFAGRFPGVLGNSIQVAQSDQTKFRLVDFGKAPTANASRTSAVFDTVDLVTSEFAFVVDSDTKTIEASSGGTGDLVTIGAFGSTPITGFTQSNMFGLTIHSITGPSDGTGITAINVHGDQTSAVVGSSTIGANSGEFFRINIDGGTFAIAKTTRPAVTGTHHDGTTVTTFFFDDLKSLGITISGDGGGTQAGGASFDFISKMSVGTTLPSQSGTNNGFITWKYAENFDDELPDTSFGAAFNGATNDLVHTIVVDEDGKWTGTKGNILERFGSRSKAPNAKDEQGRSLFYKDTINENSEYIFWLKHTDGSTFGTGSGTAWGTTADTGRTYELMKKNFYGSLIGGTEFAPAAGDFFTNGYDQFEDSETVDVSVILGGPSESATAKSIVSMVDARKDAVAFLSPARDTVLSSTDSPKASRVAAANIVAYRKGVNATPTGGDTDYSTNNLNVSSSYVVLDSGFKYMFDRFNDVFRYVPLNGDIAGIAVRSDVETETWFSPAGFNRGQLRDVIKLPFNPKQAERDSLYSNGINPVVSFPGQGTVLFGDKTLTSRPSAFDRINVRRLFIVLEKAIATAAKFSLFELNDEFTRSQFRGLIEPFLADVQSRRGITDFKVICDESNNTSAVIDRNEFVADIFVQPTRSINFITLNFIATRTGVNFDEIAGTA